MNTINGKPIGGMETHGARVRYAPKSGEDTVSMTFEELEGLWKKVRHDNSIKQ